MHNKTKRGETKVRLVDRCFFYEKNATIHRWVVRFKRGEDEELPRPSKRVIIPEIGEKFHDVLLRLWACLLNLYIESGTSKLSARCGFNY